ncbi:SRPBCC family protein [Knoellia sp. Soil729]|uniref:SRPBCC family protein n=1 Tax=Knoellia sp. Soil729 TaxID=1736394 RepID=UPI0006F94CB5|nr:SRPBCC family protein [Knoellia sp. Soil729]KRE42400.1 polyketide cyclase [Knoellia sp. Soil729]
MARAMKVSDSVVIPGVTPAEVYAQVSDPTRMSRWSPENTGAQVERGAGSLSVGHVFVGANQRGGTRWQTRCRVSAADPGERFAFDVVGWGLRSPLLRIAIARWEYTFEATEGGTRVTETWRDARRRWPDRVANAVDARLTGGRTFAAFHERNIARTLAALREDLAVHPTGP